MTRRMVLQDRFYTEPTKYNLDELERCLMHAVDENIMPLRDVTYILEQAREYYNEMSRL